MVIRPHCRGEVAVRDSMRRRIDAPVSGSWRGFGMGNSYAPWWRARGIFGAMRRSLLILATALAAAGPMWGQESAPAGDRRRFFLIPGLRFGTPAVASLSFGLASVRMQ